MVDEVKAITMWKMGFGDMNDQFFGKGEREGRRHRAIKSDWKTHRMPRARTHVKFDIPISDKEFEELAWGHVPEEMEDHWFMYFDGGAFCFHRSWTGYCIYRVHVERVEEGYLLTGATVNRSAKQYLATDDEKDAIMAAILVGQALGRDVEQLWDAFFGEGAGKE